MLKLDPKNTELLKQKQEVLNQTIKETETYLESLKKHQEEVSSSGVKLTEEQEKKYRALQREIINTQNKLNTLKTEASGWNNAGKKLEEYGDKLEDLGTKVDKVANKMTVGLTVPIVAGFTAMTKSAIETETAVQQVERIYGDAAESIKEFAESKALDYNMSASDAYKYSQIYGNLIQSITDDQKENAEQTQKLLQASSVIASATGRDMEDVMDRIRSGLLGNTEAIEDLGVNVNVALLETTDAFKQIAGDKSWDKLTFQEQQQIRLLGILEQTSKKYGDEVQDNTASSIQKLTAKTKNLTNDLGKKLLPIANKVLEKANDLVDGFNNLSDEEKDNIVKIGLMVAAAGPLLKVGSTAISTIGKVSKGFGTMTEAIGVATGKMTSSKDSVNNLAGVLKATFSPSGIASLGLTVGIGLIITEIGKATEESRKYAEECEKVAKKITEEREALEELRTSIDSDSQVELNHIERSQELWEELQKITDENGKVKEGYEKRAEVITGDLSEALGTEITMTDNVIDKYKELQDEIDTLILKKKGESILSGYEEKNSQANSNRNQKLQELIDLADEIKLAEERLSEAEKNLTNMSNVFKIGGSEKAVAEHANAKKALEELQTAYTETEKIVSMYTSDMENYEYALELYTIGTTESIQKLVDDVGTSYQKNGETVELNIARQIQAQQYLLTKSKEANQQAIYDNNITEQQKTQSSIDGANNRLNTLAQELLGMTSMTEENSPEVIDAWKQLATGSYSTYYDTVSNLKEEQAKIIQEMTGITIERTPELVEETKNMAESVLNEFKQNEKFRETAIDNLEGLLQGLEDEELRQLLKDSGIENVEEVIKGIQEGNLAEDEGEKILENLNAGLSNTAWQNTLWAKARGIASTLSGLLTVKANVNGSTSNLPGHKSGLDYVPYDNYIARLHKGERVLTAEENKQLMQMEKASRLKVPNMKAIGQSVADSIKTVFTTPTIVINAQDELTPNKINTIIDTVNKRLGSQY